MNRPLVTLALVAVAALPLVGRAALGQSPLQPIAEPSRSQIQAVLDSAKQGGLPTSALLSKAKEGMAKGASGAKIRDQVRSLYTSLKRARAALQTADSAPVDTAAIEAGAEALNAQVLKPEQLAQFANAKPGRSPALPLVLLTDLIEYRGVPSMDATAAFAKLWHDGASDAAFHGLWQQVDQDILSGAIPGTALQNRVREIPGHGRGDPPSVPDAIF